MVGERFQAHRSKERANYPVAVLCRMLEVSKSGYPTPGDLERPPRGAARTTPSHRRSARFTAGAARPTAPRGCTPSSARPGCAVGAGWPG
jgi:hypothetical protein